VDRIGGRVLLFQPADAGRRDEPLDKSATIKRKVNIMKTQVSKFLKSKIIQGVLLLVLIMAVAASIAASSQPEARVKLGGTWVGRYGDITWIGSYAPDPGGQNAVVTLQWMTLGADFEWLLGSIGAQSMSTVSGYLSMTGKDTASGKLLWYVLAPGTASTTQPAAGQVKAIAVMTSDWHFTSPDAAQGAHNLKMYAPNANGSMLPAEGAVPFLNESFQGVSHLQFH
jgi:hypothetical protein